MSRTSRPILVLGLAATFLAVPLGAMGNGNQKQDVQISLMRPADSPDGDAKGTLRARSDKKGERFDVKAMKVDAGAVLDLWMEDAVDSDVFVLVATLEGGTEQKFSVDTKKGDALPFDAEMNEDLVGRDVEVRAGAEVVLAGTMPPMDLSKKPVKAKFDLEVPEVDPPAPDMKAAVKMRSKPNKGQERIDIKAKKVPFADGKSFHVFIEDAVDSDVLVDVGELEQNGGKPAGRYKRDAKKGQMLPFGVAQVTQLGGRRIEIRDELDAVYLEGEIPAFE